jgi:hypothetical protein
MPTVLRERGYQFIIFTNDRLPPHIHVRLHVRRAEGGAKVNLLQVEVAEQYNLNRRQLSEIIELIHQHRDFLLRKWKEIQGDFE